MNISKLVDNNDTDKTQTVVKGAQENKNKNLLQKLSDIFPVVRAVKPEDNSGSTGSTAGTSENQNNTSGGNSEPDNGSEGSEVEDTRNQRLSDSAVSSVEEHDKEKYTWPCPFKAYEDN